MLFVNEIVLHIAYAAPKFDHRIDCIFILAPKPGQ
jgi:hypothetical protein